MTKVARGIQAARRATVTVWDRSKNDGHRGQGLLLDLAGEGAVVLTCHHVIAPVNEDDLCVRIPQPNGQLGAPIRARYDEQRSRPETDAVVLRADGVRLEGRPLLHELNLDKYNGSLDATVLTHLIPNNFNAEVRPSTWLKIKADPDGSWPDSPQQYELRAFRLSNPRDAREGISGGVVLCEEGVLGLVHFARAEGDSFAREDFLVPLHAWAEGWSALENLIDPLIDKNLLAMATVKRARELDVGTEVVIESYRPELYIERREVEQRARIALEHRRGVIIVGRPESGKTRLAWQLLQEWPEALVVIPNPGSDRPPDMFEPSGLAGKDLVILFDDLHRIAETVQPLQWRRRLEDASERSCLLIGTTRDGNDWKHVQTRQEPLLDALEQDTTVFTSRISGLGQEQSSDFSRDQGLQLAMTLGLSMQEFERRFDGTPGSLLLNLDGMRHRYHILRDETRGDVSMSRLLDSAKLLYVARQPSLRASILRAVAEEIFGGGRMSTDTWDALQRRTQEEGFAQFVNITGNMQIYAPYLEQCVDYEPSWEDFEQLPPLLAREKDAVGLHYLGVHYGVVGKDYNQALACIDRALDLSHDYSQAWASRSWALLELGRQEEALDASTEATNLRPEYVDAWKTIGQVLIGLGQYEKAIEALDRALDLRPDDPMLWQNKGWALSRWGRYEEALKALDRALDLRPAYPLAWQSKGLTLSRLGRREEAINWLCQAWKAREQLPREGFFVADALRELGQASEECE